MTEVEATTSGYFPRPDYLIDTLKEVEGYQKEGLDPEAEKKLDDVFEKGRKDVIGIQEEAGLGLVTEGQLAWDDILAFPATRIEGIEMGGIIRFYDNNRYYRRPIAKDELRYEKDLTVNEFEVAGEIADKPVKAVLPGPYSLADLSKNEFYGSEERFTYAFADILNKELKALENAGARTIQIDEPSLVGAEGKDAEAAINAIDRACEGVNASVLVYTYFGDLTAEVYPRLLDAVEGVGLDFVSGEKSLELLKEYGCKKELGIGCMNARNTRLEPVDELVSTVEDALELSSPETAYINPNCGLDFLPWVIMEEKVGRLGEVTDELEYTNRSTSTTQETAKGD